MEPDLAVGFLYDGARDGKAETGSNTDRLRREERLEEPLGDGRGNAWPIIGDFQAHAFAIVDNRSLDRDLVIATRSIRDRVDRIHEVVEDDLL